MRTWTSRALDVELNEEVCRPHLTGGASYSCTCSMLPSERGRSCGNPGHVDLPQMAHLSRPQRGIHIFYPHGEPTDLAI